MDANRSSGPAVFFLALVAIVAIALVAFVAIRLLEDTQEEDGGSAIPIPTLEGTIIPGAVDPVSPAALSPGRIRVSAFALPVFGPGAS